MNNGWLVSLTSRGSGWLIDMVKESIWLMMDGLYGVGWNGCMSRGVLQNAWLPEGVYLAYPRSKWIKMAGFSTQSTIYQSDWPSKWLVSPCWYQLTPVQKDKHPICMAICCRLPSPVVNHFWLSSLTKVQPPIMGNPQIFINHAYLIGHEQEPFGWIVDRLMIVSLLSLIHLHSSLWIIAFIMDPPVIIVVLHSPCTPVTPHDSAWPKRLSLARHPSSPCWPQGCHSDCTPFARRRRCRHSWGRSNPRWSLAVAAER